MTKEDDDIYGPFGSIEEEREIAEDDLGRITALKKDLAHLLVHMSVMINSYTLNMSQDAVVELGEALEEAFDDALFEDWHRLHEISKTAIHPSRIPSVFALDATLNALKVAAEMRRNGFKAVVIPPKSHGRPQNPATLIAIGKLEAGNA